MRGWYSAILVCALLMSWSDGLNASAVTRHHGATRRHRTTHRKTHRPLVHKAEWAGAGVAAGQVAGPVGGATVGAAHYRKDLKAGGRRRRRAAVKIGAPIAATAIAGPVGTVG